jgi:hypothetical protein
MMMRKWFFAVALLTSAWIPASAPGLGQGVDTIQETAEKLATALRKNGRKKVAVLPLLFVEDKTKEQKARDNAMFAPDTKIELTEKILSASKDSIRLAEQMQTYLSQASQGDFGVVPSEDLLERLNTAKGDTRKLTPTGKDLAALVNPAGDIDAYIVGTIQRQFEETKNDLVDRTILGPELTGCEWKVMDPSNRTLLVSDVNEPNCKSMAEAVYNGLSAEYFRYQNGRLTCLLEYRQEDRKDVPLLPSDAHVLYNKGYGLNSLVHPLINSNCPFKVQFEVGDRILPVYIAESKPFRSPVILSDVVINLEPGDEPVIRVTNTLGQRVMIAVFVDGVNILGKVRELPDESCRGWVLEPSKTARFKSWWTVKDEKEVEEERFVIQEWSESIAGKMGMQGDADSSRTITLVFYTDGIADRNAIAFFPRSWYQRASLTPNRQGVRVTEQLEAPNSVGAAPNMFGMGAKKAVPGQLQWVKGAKNGTMLASMTVWYCPSSDTKRMFKRLIEKDGAVMGNHISIVPISINR